MASSTLAAASTTTAKTDSSTISADVAAKVKQALAPAAAAGQKVTAALAQGQAKLSSLGQLKSAIADFQTVAQKLGSNSADTGARLASFVSAFNTLNGKLQSLQKGELKGDPALTLASTQLAQTVRESGPSSGGATLAKAGISIDSSGVMKQDSSKLAAALASDPAAVAALLAPNGGGVVDRLATRLGELNTGNGSVAREQAAAGKQVSVLETRQAALTKTLTAQASALAALYSSQANAGTSGTPTSLFDMMA